MTLLKARRTMRSSAVVALAVVTLSLVLVEPALATGLTLSTSVGTPTTTVQVSGSGFPKNGLVTISFDVSELTTTVANASGKFSSVSITIPAGATPGPHEITASNPSGTKAAQAAFTVRTDWAQFQSGPTHQGFDRYEDVISTANVADLEKDWTYDAGATLIGEPVVVGGTMYLATTANQVLAVDEASRTLLWTFNTPATPTMPAVAAGRVVVGDSSGDVFGLNAASGASVWPFENIGGSVLAPPTIAAGLAYLTSTAGKVVVFDLGPGTGDGISLGLGNPGSSPASVLGGIIYLCVTGGTCTSSDPSTNTVLWTKPGLVGPASPILIGGRSIIDAAGRAYALDQDTGGTDWGPIMESFTPARLSGAAAHGVTYIPFGLEARGLITGAERWGTSECVGPTITGNADENAVLANGVLYLSMSNAVCAFDADTGAILWDQPLAAAPSLIVNDGTVLVATGSKIVAYDLAT